MIDDHNIYECTTYTQAIYINTMYYNFLLMYKMVFVYGPFNAQVFK